MKINVQYIFKKYVVVIPTLLGVYLHYTPCRGGIIVLSHDVDVLEATGSSKKLAACNFNRVRSRPRAYIMRYTPAVFLKFGFIVV